MGIAQPKTSATQGFDFAEDIRLVIWDLDETFWDGTLTEGGMSYRMDHHTLVKTLAGRGIMSAICSKNEFSAVEEVLRRQGIWDYFIFPSIDWTLKGPRIAAMLKQIGLRAESTLFLDDNPMNLAQAVHANPGLNVAEPVCIGTLRDAPQLQGRPDKDLSRLAQYKVKERKASAALIAGDDAIAFLRQSNVRVMIEYDVEAHLDRAIELINRTNQLNFTKERLSDDVDTARAALLSLLSRNTTDAGLIRVRDDFGDYGFAGFYLTERRHNVRHLRHFCFSCRTLNMYVEHWTYKHLGQPPMTVVGPVLSDVEGSPVRADWITPMTAAQWDAPDPLPRLQFDHIIARGGCDLASLMHYFALHTDDLIEEFNVPQNGQMFRRDHSAFLLPALDRGMTPQALQGASELGYPPENFTSVLGDPPLGKSLCFLSFWADADIPVYRHSKSGLCVPYWLVGAQNHDLIAKDELRAAVAETDIQRARLNRLCSAFEHEGLLTQDEMERRYRIILDALPVDFLTVIMLAPERGPVQFRSPKTPAHPHHQRLNQALRAVAKGRERVVLLDPADFIDGAEDMIDLNHFKRPVYHRMYRHLLDVLSPKENGA